MASQLLPSCLWADVEYRPVQRRQDVDGGKVTTDVAGTRVVDRLQVLNTNLQCRLGNLRNLLITMSIGQQVEDRHRDVLVSKGNHASTSWPFPLRAIEVSRTSSTSR